MGLWLENPEKVKRVYYIQNKQPHGVFNGCIYISNIYIYIPRVTFWVPKIYLKDSQSTSDPLEVANTNIRGIDR